MIKIHTDSDPELESPSAGIPEEIVSAVLKKENVSQAEVNLIFGSDGLLNRLKKAFFHVDQFTDVIAFRLNEYDEEDVEGEIYISLPRAKENAQNYEEPFNREVARLLIHGTLHLLNYDDQTEEEKILMSKKEDDLLNQVNWEKLF